MILGADRQLLDVDNCLDDGRGPGDHQRGTALVLRRFTTHGMMHRNPEFQHLKHLIVLFET